MQKSNNMALTKELLEEIRKLPVEDKAIVMHDCAEEFFTVEKYHQYTKIPKRTIYDNFGTDKVRGVDICGHKLIYM